MLPVFSDSFHFGPSPKDVKVTVKSTIQKYSMKEKTEDTLIRPFPKFVFLNV